LTVSYVRSRTNRYLKLSRVNLHVEQVNPTTTTAWYYMCVQAQVSQT